MSLAVAEMTAVFLNRAHAPPIVALFGDRGESYAYGYRSRRRRDGARRPARNRDRDPAAAVSGGELRRRGAPQEHALPGGAQLPGRRAPARDRDRRHEPDPPRRRRYAGRGG